MPQLINGNGIKSSIDYSIVNKKPQFKIKVTHHLKYIHNKLEEKYNLTKRNTTITIDLSREIMSPMERTKNDLTYLSILLLKITATFASIFLVIWITDIIPMLYARLKNI